MIGDRQFQYIIIDGHFFGNDNFRVNNTDYFLSLNESIPLSYSFTSTSDDIRVAYLHVPAQKSIIGHTIGITKCFAS